MPLNLIYARATNGVIGNNNQLPWHLPEDLAHFKQTTRGCPVIMGRKTWDSLPEAFRPLPGRTNLVVTRQTDWQASGALVAHSIEHAVSMCDAQATLWVIGGAQIYEQALPLADEIVVTEIELTPEGDAFAPVLDASWQEISRESHTNSKGLTYHFVKLHRLSKGGQTHV